MKQKIKRSSWWGLREESERACLYIRPFTTTIPPATSLRDQIYGTPKNHNTYTLSIYAPSKASKELNITFLY